MNDKKPLMDYRRVQKLQTPLLLTGALLSGVGTSVSVPLVILGIALCHRDRGSLLPLSALRQTARTHR